MAKRKITPPVNSVILRDDRGREVVQFTTPCGVRATVATEIPMAVLEKFEALMRRKLAKAGIRA